MNMDMYIENAEKNYKGFIKENVFIMKDNEKGEMGRGMLSPLFNYDVCGDVPLNIYFTLEVYQMDNREMIMDMLFEKILRKIKYILKELDEISGRVYTICEIRDKECVDYYVSKGLDEKSPVIIAQRKVPDEFMYISNIQGIEIRKSCLDDESELNRFLDYQNKIFFYKMNKIDVESFKNKNGAVIMNAYDKNELIGSSMAYIKDGDIGYLKLIFVNKNYRNQKIGMELLLNCYKHFRDHGVKFIQLEVPTINTGAIEFYKKLGFEMIEEKYLYLCKTFMKEEKEIE